jgi:superfamily II DNA/RNA helicase
MDALHLPHITIKNPQAGVTLKALYKLNLLKRLESSTFAFIKSIKTLHDSETRLLSLLENFKEDVHISDIHTVSNDTEEEETVTLDEYAQNEKDAQELENTLEDLGFDQGSLRDGSQEEVQELADATVGEVISYIYEDLCLLAYFVSMFIGEIGEQAYQVRDNSVEMRSWLNSKGVARIPDVPEDEVNPTLYPNADLADAPKATRDFYESVFALREFRDPKIDRLVKILSENEGKVLVFTQYRATARYIHSSLLGHSDSPTTSSNSAVVVGGDDHKQEVIKRFAPNASGYQRQLTNSSRTELQYVVATDTLSEGVNLQDVETVVNYDLPWNPMRIVQRVGRVDRIGNTDDKYVHNFYPDGDIEATIKLLKRLQAKISDIALVVGKENNILDPNEDEVLERAGVETEKTIGEIQRDEIEDTLKKSREVRDINELDDTRRNAVLSQAGSDEERAFERLLLREELLDDHDLEPEDFEYAEEYFETTPEERDSLYTCYDYFKGTLEAGVFGLAHVWYDDKDSPLNRVERILCHVPFGEEPQHIGKVRAFNIDANTNGKKVKMDEETVLEERVKIEEITEERREELEAGQSEEQFKQGGDISKEQERIIGYLEHLHKEEGIEKADELRDRLVEVGLDNTDEDRVLRETFREDERTLVDWNKENFFEEVEEFLNEYVEKSYQETLAGTSGVNAELMCWGVIEK